MTNNLKCKITIECSFERYIQDDNTSSKIVTREFSVKYLPLLEDILYRLQIMGQFDK